MTPLEKCLQQMGLYFKSGNKIPIERATVRTSEFEELRDEALKANEDQERFLVLDQLDSIVINKWMVMGHFNGRWFPRYFDKPSTHVDPIELSPNKTRPSVLSSTRSGKKLTMNPNDGVRIRPTEEGWKQIRAHVDDFNVDMSIRHPCSDYRMSMPEADEDGYIRGQFWSLMEYFEWGVAGLGRELPFLDMRLTESDQDRKIEALIAQLNEARADERQAMLYLSEVRNIVGGKDFPDMIEKIKELAGNTKRD